jgi:predicted  nucleic acid-binding Zn-ribbon protein
MSETTGPAASSARNYREVAREIVVNSFIPNRPRDEASVKISAALRFTAAARGLDVETFLVQNTGLTLEGEIDTMGYGTVTRLYDDLKSEAGCTAGGLDTDELTKRATWARHMYALQKLSAGSSEQPPVPPNNFDVDVMLKSVIAECGGKNSLNGFKAYIGWKVALNFPGNVDPRRRPSDASILDAFSDYFKWWMRRPPKIPTRRRGAVRAAANSRAATGVSVSGASPAAAGVVVVAIADGDGDGGDNQGDNLAPEEDTALPFDGWMASAGEGDEGDRDDDDGGHIAFDDSFGGGSARVDPRAAESDESSIDETTEASRLSAPPATSRRAVGAEQQGPSKRQRVESEDAGGSLETPGVVDARTGSFNGWVTSDAAPTGCHEMRSKRTGAVSISALLEEDDDDDEEFFDAENGDDDSELNAPPSAGLSPRQLSQAAVRGEVSPAEATEVDLGLRSSTADEASETPSPPTPSTRGVAAIGVGPACSVRVPNNNCYRSTNHVPLMAPIEPSWVQAVIGVHASEKKDLQAQLFAALVRNGVLEEQNRLQEESNRRLEGLIQSLQEQLSAKEEEVEVFKQTTIAELDEKTRNLKEQLSMRHNELDALKKQYKEDCEKLRAGLDAGKQAHQDDVRELERQMKVCADQREEVQSKLEDSEEAVKAMTLQVEAHAMDRAEKDEDASKRQVELDQYKAKCKKLRGALDEVKQAHQADVRALERQLKESADQYEEVRSIQAGREDVLKILTLQVAALQVEIEEMNGEACKRQVELTQYKEDCEKLRGDLDAGKQAYQDEVRELQRTLKESAEQYDAVRSKLAETEESLKALTLQVEVHETDRAEKDEDARKRQVELDQYKAECTRLRSDLDSGKQAHEDSVRELERQLKKSVDQCEELRNKLEKATGDAEDWEHQWDLVSDQLFTDQTELGVLKKELETLKKQIEDNEKTIKDYKQRVSSYYAKNLSLRQRLAGLGQPLQEEPMPDACASSNVKVEGGDAVGSAASPDRTTSGAPREELLPAATT